MRGHTGPFRARFALVIVLGAITVFLAACADVRVDYTFMEDGSYQVEGQVVVTEVTQYTDQRLARLRDRLTQAGLVVTPLADPGQRGFAFAGDSASGEWAELPLRGTPRLREEQGMVSRKSAFTWVFDWGTVLDDLFPERLFQDEADSLPAADFQVTVTFPEAGASHNGDPVDGSGGRTVSWTVIPLESNSLRAERSVPVWWRVALVPVFVVGGIALLVYGRVRPVRAAPSSSTVPLVAEPPSPRVPTGAAPSDPAPSRAVCPVCDGPMEPGQPCGRCLAAVEAAEGE
ncbi:MAG: hypothetical protein KKA32_07460 [Actinobacteria bacterium]|nr:hypothetical protein [Actinomycetota bacterium]